MTTRRELEADSPPAILATDPLKRLDAIVRRHGGKPKADTPPPAHEPPLAGSATLRGAAEPRRTGRPVTAPRRRRSTTPVECWCKYRHQHGTRRMYVTHTCGCFDCRVAHARSVQRVRAGGSTTEHRYVDPTGTRRRIEALSAAGFSHADVARHLGTTKEAIAYFRTATRVHVATEERITAVYDTFTALQPPTGWRADRTRREAAARGWVPPLAWDDDEIRDPLARPYNARREPDTVDMVAVDAVIGGRLVTLTKAERAEVVRILTDRGLSAALIAERLGITSRTVVRARTAA